MLKFKEFLAEAKQEENAPEHPIVKMHELLNKSQLKTIRSHKDFKTYIEAGHPYNSHLLARHAHVGQPSAVVHRFMVLNSANPNHRMHIAIGNRGKYFWHEIHKRDEKDPNSWSIVKHGTADK